MNHLVEWLVKGDKEYSSCVIFFLVLFGCRREMIMTSGITKLEN